MCPLAGVSELVLSTSTGYTCAVCTKDFSDKSNCRRHIKEKHFGLNQLPCPFCHQIYLKRYIQGHMTSCRRATPLADPLNWFVSCVIKIYAGSVSDLVLSTNQGFSCQLCGKLFSDKSNCRRHVRETHQKLGQYACSFCNKVLHRSKIQHHMIHCLGHWTLFEINIYLCLSLFSSFSWLIMFRCWWSCKKNRKWICLWILQQRVCERIQLQKTCEGNPFEHGSIQMSILWKDYAQEQDSKPY